MLRPAKCASVLQRQAHFAPTPPAIRHSVPRRWSHTHKHNASDKLFADAAREEAEGASQQKPSQKVQSLEQEHENWTGEESMKDAVLRMLVDKYKPLRGPTILTAEQKLKQAPPKIPPSGTVGASIPSHGYLKPRSGSWADEPLLPSNEAHKPWETTFKAPSSEGPLSIKFAGVLPPPSISGSVLSGTSSIPAGTLDERLAGQEKQKAKKAREVGRLSQALESTLDYKLGLKRGQTSHGTINPTSVKGWNNLIEEKIQKARSTGVFENVKGRGKPLVRSTDESNPFIAREEFLMNRIIQRNGATPPWVEAQYELESAVRNFREILRQSWVRRALRILTTENPAELLHKITLDEIKGLRDPIWVKKEQSYHEAGISELNSLVRKYNGLAPYAVRRTHYYTRETEIGRMYEGSAEDVMHELRERLRDPGLVGNRSNGESIGGQTTRGAVGIGSDSAKLGGAMPTDQVPSPATRRLWDLIREWFNNRLSSRRSR